MSEVVIDVRGLELRGFHGALEEEQREGQRFVFDVTLVAHDAGVRSDQLADTVDYTAVVARIREISNGQAVQPDRSARGGDRGRPPPALSGLARARPRAQARGPARRAGRVHGCHRRAQPALTRAYVGLGANLGDREGTIRRAVELLGAEPGVEVVAVSTLRETDPVGYADQPRFLNGAAAVETELAPARASRPAPGRRARARPRPRTGARATARGPSTSTCCSTAIEVVDEPGLTVPHPRLAERRFALEPLHELDPGLRLPDGRGRAGTARRAVTMRRMSHLDELDEYEAELELRLKREYSAVFSLFRYCIVTQDSTYLCNRHELKVLPQTTYPFFHLTMEDVWVWDKNRPTRIIPRAEVYTSSDVTIEELRGEGDGPALTPEALAQKLGETLGGDEEQL